MKVDFNANWKFYKDGNEAKAYFVNLPHDAMLTEKRFKESNNGTKTGFFPGGKYVYEKEFVISEEHIGKYVALLFEGIYRHATLYINDQELMYHANGYTEFTVDISDRILIGKNKIKVIVDNSLTPNSRWYSGSGIYRPVSLILKEKQHISNVKIRTVSIKPAEIFVEVEGDDAENAIVEIYDGNIIVASGKIGKLMISNVKLWSESSPFLYTALIKTGTDEERISFGIRSLFWSAKDGLLVNNVETKLRGACIHHDNGVLGACGFADAEERRVRILKESGYNAIRSAHNPCSRALLDACDKYGVYVMDELYDGWYTPKTYHDSSREFKENYPQDMLSMIMKDYNHPSVIMYSIGNEVSEPCKTEGVETTRKLVELVHSLDASRPATCGVNIMIIQRKMTFTNQGEYKKEPIPDTTPGKKEKASGSTLYNLMAVRIGGIMCEMVKSKKADNAIKDMASYLDIVGFNYGDTRYDIDGKLHPERILLGSETMVSRIWYSWPRVMKYKYVLGDFVWTGFDYLGETDIGHWSHEKMNGLPLLNGGGTIDILGNRDAENYYQQVAFGIYRKPYICVRPVNLSGLKIKMAPWRMTNAVESWSWHGYEGKNAIIEVYTTEAVVELFLNDKSLGKKKAHKNKAIFKTRYQAGILKAVSYDVNGNAIAENKLSSGGNKTRLKIMPEKTTLVSNGQDLCYIPIILTDENGQWKPVKDVKITVSMKGNSVTLAGLGSAHPETDELFSSLSHDTYQGRALAVFRATYEPGTTEVTISAEGIEKITLNILVERWKGNGNIK
jgi:Beta-galactosidase/beta-glucuronidase